MAKLQLPTARVFVPLLEPARYKGAYGGRGSGKSQFFAGLSVEQCIMMPGTRILCVREVQKSLKESAKRLIEDKIAEHGLLGLFDCLSDRIVTPGDGVIVFAGMQDHTAESIKSYEGFDFAWVEEAQTLSRRSLQLLRPTIRKEGSEIWFSWNPRRKTDAVDEFLRQKTVDNAITVSANWRDNPWFPDVLEEERRTDQREYPDQYAHIWEGDYAGVIEGAYYASCLHDAKNENRIGCVGADPLMKYRAFWDIGGTGAKSDAVAIWIAQFVGREIRVLDYYEAVGQPLAAHVEWLRKSRPRLEKGYSNALMVLPHDGDANDKVHDVSYASALRDALFEVDVIANQGKGAAAARIERGRRMFPRIWFNAETTAGGREALGWYHEKKDEARNIGLGPEHDWSSHGADAFGLMCIAYEEPKAMEEIVYDTRWVV